jgi:adenylylsulfate kinase-like enzyme
LWQRAARGEIETLPGAGFPFEAPQDPEAAVDTSALNPDAAAQRVYKRLSERGFFCRST